MEKVSRILNKIYISKKEITFRERCILEAYVEHYEHLLFKESERHDA